MQRVRACTMLLTARRSSSATTLQHNHTTHGYMIILDPKLHQLSVKVTNRGRKQTRSRFAFRQTAPAVCRIDALERTPPPGHHAHLAVCMRCALG
jgi:hypothetical protein